MRKGHLAVLPVDEGRRSERRLVNLAATLREPGASLVDAEILDLSEAGFGAELEVELEAGTQIWLKLPGIEPAACRLVWQEGRRAGFEFLTPLHPATLELIMTTTRAPAPKRRFGLTQDAR